MYEVLSQFQLQYTCNLNLNMLFYFVNFIFVYICFQWTVPQRADMHDNRKRQLCRGPVITKCQQTQAEVQAHLMICQKSKEADVIIVIMLMVCTCLLRFQNPPHKKYAQVRAHATFFQVQEQAITCIKHPFTNHLHAIYNTMPKVLISGN